MTKYRARKSRIDGHMMDSAAELSRYAELKLLEFANEITDLKVHPKYELIVDGEKIGIFTPDFRYIDKTGAVVVEDVKSIATMTEASSLRIRLFQALYKIPVTLVGKNVPKVRRFKTKAAA